MDYQAIIEALDARTQEAFKAWGETFAKGMAQAMEERDARLAEQSQRIAELSDELEAVKGQSMADRESMERILRDSMAMAQKQVREALSRAPIPTYKGVFERGAEYQAGDMVTHKGSIWHCNAAIDSETPGTGDAWTLAVKCGRDGKDLTKEPV